jgi:hypothetical protein
LICLLCGPAVVFASRADVSGISWIEPPSAGDVGRVLVELAGGNRLVLLALLAAGSYGMVSLVRERRPWPQWFVALWLAVPVILSFAVSLVRPVFLSYYLIICVPALALFGASGIARGGRPVLSAALAVPLLALSTDRLVAYYRAPGQDYRGAARHVIAAMRPGDGILFFPNYVRKPFEYYERQDGITGPVNLDRSPEWAARGRIWLVIREAVSAVDLPELRRLQSSLLAGHRLEDRIPFHRVRVELYVQ